MRSVRSSLSIGRLAIYPRNSNIRTGKFHVIYFRGQFHTDMLCQHFS